MSYNGFIGHEMRILTLLLEKKENFPPAEMKVAALRVDRCLRSQDQHCLLVHGKYVKNRRRIKCSMLNLPNIVTIGVNYVHKMEIRGYGIPIPM